MHMRIIETRNNGTPAAVDEAGRGPAQTENLFVSTGGSHLSIRNSDRLHKRGHFIRGDLGVVQDDFSRHTSLLLRFLSPVRTGGSKLPPCSLLVSYGKSGDHVFGELRGWSAVYHRVHVLDADPVGSVVAFHDVHHGIVGALVGPVALPFEHDGHGRDRLCASLNDTLHRVVVSKLTHVAAAIFHHVDFVAVMNRLYRWKRNTDFCPKAGNENLLATAFFDRGDKVSVVPRVHGRTLDGFLPREYGSQLRPHISAERLGLDRC